MAIAHIRRRILHRDSMPARMPSLTARDNMGQHRRPRMGVAIVARGRMMIAT